MHPDTIDRRCGENNEQEKKQKCANCKHFDFSHVEESIFCYPLDNFRLGDRLKLSVKVGDPGEVGQIG